MSLYKFSDPVSAEVELNRVVSALNVDQFARKERRDAEPVFPALRACVRRSFVPVDVLNFWKVL